MWRLSRFLPKLHGGGLELAGIALAGMSAVFALSMTTSPPSAPGIRGIEHFSIYAQRGRPTPAFRGPRTPSIDYQPIGSLKQGGDLRLVGFEILQASRESAMLRTPEGRVTRISPGKRVAGLGIVIAIEPRGRGWVIKTEAGAID
jgi:hypothetical protein